jgi:Transposase domain (DUF772)
LHDRSFDECEREVRGSLVCRPFCRIDGERVPDATTLIRLAHLLDEPVLNELRDRLAAIMKNMICRGWPAAGHGVDPIGEPYPPPCLMQDVLRGS